MAIFASACSCSSSAAIAPGSKRGSGRTCGTVGRGKAINVATSARPQVVNKTTPFDRSLFATTLSFNPEIRIVVDYLDRRAAEATIQSRNGQRGIHRVVRVRP